MQVDADHSALPFAPGRWLPRPVNCLKVVADGADVPMRVLNPIGRVYEAPKGVSGSPAMVCKQAGGSRRVYFPGLLQSMYADYQMQDLQRWLTGAVR